ncbi:unnamed protein product [Amoebophrya sp. A120]|nr:unnamed protein product [Amoebophrya sp. A120]|eukprot:GSA120T00018567001.1
MSTTTGAAQASSGGRFYGKEGFQPRRILRQMITLQTGWYSVFFAVAGASNLAVGIEWTGVAKFFTSTEYNFDTTSGTVLVCSQWVASILYAPFISYIVERAKKVLDFTVTIQFWHLLLSLYFGFPGLSWWGVSLVGCVVGTLIAEAICMRWEMQDIELKYSPVATTTTNGNHIGAEMPDTPGGSHALPNVIGEENMLNDFDSDMRDMQKRENASKV